MLAPDVRVVATELLRPPPGFALDRAVLTTYTLDLETLLALPLAVLAHADQGLDELLADPLLLVEALRQAGGRLHVFVDEDGLAVPRTARELYALLEPCVHPVRAPHGGVFHPKVWAARFVDGAGDVRLRIAVLSRNLTFDRSWDIALTTEATPGTGARRLRASADLGGLLRAVGDLAVLGVPPDVTAALDELASEMERTAFPSPPGFAGDVEFIARGVAPSGRLWLPMQSGLRVLAVAPFVTAEPLAALAKHIGGSRTLVSRQDELDALPASALEPWDEVFVLSDAALDETDDDQTRPSGLHAKLVAIEYGWDVSWWVGSANLTSAAWRGHNVEMMARVHGKKGREKGHAGEGIARFRESGFLNLCQPYRRVEKQPEDAAVVGARNALRKARQALVRADLRIDCMQAEGGWQWRLNGKLDIPDGVVAEIWPVTVRQERARHLDLPSIWRLPEARLTAFVAFRLRVPSVGIESERIARKLPTSGLPEGRVNHVLRGLISTPERLLRFLRAMLGGLEGLVLTGGGSGANGEGEGWAAGLGGDTLLEDFVRAASRDPGRLEPVGRILQDLAQTEEGRRIIPPGLMQTWNAVQRAMMETRR